LQGWLASGRSEEVPKVSEIVNLMLVDGGNDVAILEASDGGCQGDDKKEKEWNCEEAKEEGTLLYCASSTRVRLIVAQLLSG
jgi:hypothetical protein